MKRKELAIRKVKNKRYKYLWSKMQDKNIILRAWKNLRKGKTKRIEVKRIDGNLDAEIEKMRLMIKETVPEHPERGYKPPRIRKTKIVHEHSKKRIAHLASIHEQWYFHIIVEVMKPIVLRRLHHNVIGCVPGRGSHTGKRTIEEWIKNGDIRYFYKSDVRKFYDNTQIAIVIRELRRDIADERFLYCIAKIYSHIKRGILIGLYISPWLANYVLTTVDESIEKAGVKMIRYVDDIVVGATSKKKLRLVHKAITVALSKLRLKLKRTWQIFRFDYNGKGRPLDFMGFLFLRDRTLIRKSIMLRATRTARRLRRTKDEGRRMYAKMIRGMVSRMGWFKYTASYDCYLAHIKPFVNIGKLKKIVSKLDRKENKNERMENRALLAGA